MILSILDAKAYYAARFAAAHGRPATDAEISAAAARFMDEHRLQEGVGKYDLDAFIDSERQLWPVRSLADYAPGYHYRAFPEALNMIHMQYILRSRWLEFYGAEMTPQQLAAAIQAYVVANNTFPLPRDGFQTWCEWYVPARAGK